MMIATRAVLLAHMIQTETGRVVATTDIQTTSALPVEQRPGDDYRLIIDLFIEHP